MVSSYDCCMRILCNRYFLTLLLFGLLIYVSQKTGVVLPSFIRNYFNDLLILPIVLWIVLAFIREIKGKEFSVSWVVAIALATYYSLFFEWYLPQFHSRYTADVYDVFCYFFGAFTFLLFQSKIKRT